MEADDDFMVVIVGDADKNAEEGLEKLVSIKEEPQELEDSMTIEEFMETVEKHGEMVQFDINLANVKEEQSSEEEEEYVDDDILEFDDDQGVFLRKRQKFYEDNSTQRHTMVKPEERKSLVDELRQANPDYVENPELLIDHLVDIMRSIKAPTPPDGYYYLNQNAAYVCFKCGSESVTLPAASRHYQEKHGTRYLICFACGVDFRSTTNLYKHEKCCASPDSVFVLKARARRLGRKGRGRPYLLTKQELEKRNKENKYTKNKKAAKQIWSCELCPARFQCAVGLEAHRNLHEGRRPHRCARCAAAYTSKSALLRHISKHNDQVYICDHCGRSFKVKAALVAHMDTHRLIRKHRCTQCGKRYAQRAALLLHIRKEHLQLPPPFACQICDKRFARMSLLKVHMKDKHGMIIMTRKMFFKKLPTMTDSQVVEKAKLVFRSDMPFIDHTRLLEKDHDITYEFLNTIQDAEFEEVPSIEECENDEEQQNYVFDYSGDGDHSLDTEDAKVQIEGDKLGGQQDENTEAEVQIQIEIEPSIENSIIEIKEEHISNEDHTVEVSNDSECVESDAEVAVTQETVEGILSDQVETHKHHNIIVAYPGIDCQVVDKSQMNNVDEDCKQIKIPQRVLRRTNRQKPVQTDRKMMVRITGTRLSS